MKRFILIDQSITGEGGHYLTYARSVLDAAEQECFLPVLCVNYRFCQGDTLPYRIYPAFTYTSAESLSTFRLRSHVSKKERGYLWGGVVKPLVQRVARTVFGAHYSQVRARFFPSNKIALDGDAEQTYKAARFEADLRKLLSVLSLGEEDVVFFPTISNVELYGLEQALRGLETQRLPTFHLLFRWSPFHGRRQDYERELLTLQYTQKIFRICEDLYEKRAIAFYTDTQRLAEQYNLFSRCRFSVLPIPHTGHSVCAARREEKVISYLGDARPEKGFLHLPKLVDALSDEKVRFQIQANYNIPGGEGGIAACRRELKRRKNVTLYESPLSTEAYAAALARTDIMLILYDREQYYARSSGIFAEAAAAGIPVIVPADTWMSAQVCKGRNMQLQKVVEQFGIRRIRLCMENRVILWRRESSIAGQAVLRLEVDWDSGGDSIRVEVTTQGIGTKKKIDFVERTGDGAALLMITAKENSREVTLDLKGAYGQRLPAIKRVEIIELSNRIPEFGEIGAIYDDFAQCEPLIRDVIRQYPLIRERAETFAQDWAVFHNPQSFLKKLL